MGKIIKFKKPGLVEINRGRTLCKNGFHKWETITENQFDVKSGKLVTVLRCKRCGAEKNKLT